MLARLRSAWRTHTSRTRFEQDLSQELESHIELLADDLTRPGLPRSEALRRARAEFGAVDAAKEGCREAVGALWLDGMLRDIRFSMRLFAKGPGFTFVVIAILALSIGANVAIFSVVDAVLLRGLPYPEPDRLAQIVTVVLRDGEVRYEQEAQDGSTWEAVRDDMAFIETAVYSPRSTGVNLVAAADGARYVRRGRVPSGLFRVLGVEPAQGREFTRDEDRPGGPAVALLSHELFRSAFHSNLAVVGKAITLRGEAHTVVGVMPEGFETHVPADLWTPMRATASGEGGGSNYTVIARIPLGDSRGARLRPGWERRARGRSSTFASRRGRRRWFAS